MRYLYDKFYNLIVTVHVFINRKRVKAAGSLLYVAGAVIMTLARSQLRLFARTFLQTQNVVQLKLLLTTGLNQLGAVIQQAETIFR